MNPDNRREPWLDPDFLENQRRFPAEELLRRTGQHIAWSWDGSGILAPGTDPDRRALDEKLHAPALIRVRSSMIMSRILI